MKSTIKLCSLAMAIAVAIGGCTQKEAPKVSETKPATESPLTAKSRRFAPTDITADATQLSENDRKALDKIIEAAKLLDPLFLRQVWSGNEALEKNLEQTPVLKDVSACIISRSTKGRGRVWTKTRRSSTASRQ